MKDSSSGRSLVVRRCARSRCQGRKPREGGVGAERRALMPTSTHQTRSESDRRHCTSMRDNARRLLVSHLSPTLSLTGPVFWRPRTNLGISCLCRQRHSVASHPRRSLEGCLFQGVDGRPAAQDNCRRPSVEAVARSQSFEKQLPIGALRSYDVSGLRIERFGSMTGLSWKCCSPS
jgi:hypothetical protein